MKGSFLRELCIFIIHGLRKGSLCKLFYSFWPEVDVSSSSALSIKTTFLLTEIWNPPSTCCMTHAAAVGRFSRLKTQFDRERSEASRAGGRKKWSWRLNLALLFRLFYYNCHSFWEWYVTGNFPNVLKAHFTKFPQPCVGLNMCQCFANTCLTSALQGVLPEMGTQWVAAATWKQLR